MAVVLGGRNCPRTYDVQLELSRALIVCVSKRATRQTLGAHGFGPCASSSAAAALFVVVIVVVVVVFGATIAPAAAAARALATAARLSGTGTRASAAALGFVVAVAS